MTNKEILLDGIKLKNTPRLPVITLSSGVWTYSRNGLTLQDALEKNPQKIAEYVIKNSAEVDSDLIWMGADCNNIALQALGAMCTFDVLGMPANVEKPLVTSLEEVESLKIEKLEADRGLNNLLETTRIIADRVGGQYLLGASQWGPFTLAGQLMGIEPFMKIAMKNPSGAKYILEFTEKLVIKYLKLFTQAGAELVCQAEPSSSGDMISKKMFENLAFPAIKNVNISLREAAKARMLHICGNTSKILELIPETETDLFSFDYKVDLAIAREKLGGKIAFAGQIDPVRVLLEGTAEDVSEAAETCIQIAGQEAGYVLMPGCDIPPKTKIENVKAMVAAAHNKRM